MVEIDELLATPQWAAARRRAESGPRVLLATSMGGFNHGAVTDKALAIALTLRGAKVELFLCDGAPACHLTKIGKESPERIVQTDLRTRCSVCSQTGAQLMAPLGLRVVTLSQLATNNDELEAEAWAKGFDATAPKGAITGAWNLEEHALAGALRYFARDELSSEPLGPQVARKFAKSAMLTARAVDRLLAADRYEVVCANHGIYVPQGVIGEVARARGVRVVNWNPAYRRHCFIFSHGDTYHHTMISEPVSAWQGMDLTSARRERIARSLRDRRQASGDWIWFNRAQDASRDEITAKLGLDARPIVLALTSVVWDACLHYESNAFASMADWMIDTIAYFEARPDLQLVVRIHPAEMSGFVKSRARMSDIIANAFAELPQNVTIVSAEDPLSTYSLIDEANAVIVYSTKTGIEASAQGLPVIVAGEAWIRNKGFSYDADSPHAYRALLDTLPFQEPMSEYARERALRYAYHFFFRRMIELPFLAEAGAAKFEIHVDELDCLGPGSHAGLDCVCDGILTGSAFVQDALDAAMSPLCL